MKVAISTLAFLGSMVLSRGEDNNSNMRRSDINRELGSKNNNNHQYTVWYGHGDTPPPPPPPPPGAGSGHWVFYPHPDHSSKWDDDDDDDDDGHDDDDDDSHLIDTDSPTASPIMSTSSPTSSPTTPSPTVGYGWDDDGYDPLNKKEPEVDNVDGDVDDDEGADTVTDDESNKTEQIIQKPQTLCFENGSLIECTSEEPQGKEVYYEYKYKIEISPEEQKERKMRIRRRRQLESDDEEGYQHIVNKLENALLHEFAHLMDSNSLAMQALTRLVGPPSDEVSDEEDCTSEIEGNECYIMVGKLSAYMMISSSNDSINEKEFTCDVYSYLKYIVDYGDFSSIERLDALEFLGSDNQYCWTNIMADSFRSANEAKEEPTTNLLLSGGALVGVVVGGVVVLSALLVAMVVMRRNKRMNTNNNDKELLEDGDLEEYDIESISSDQDVDIQADIVIPESQEANEKEIEVQDSLVLREMDARFTIDEEEAVVMEEEKERMMMMMEEDNISYTSDDLESV